MFVYSLLISFTCNAQKVPKAQNTMNINLEIESGETFVVYKNNTSDVIRIWQPDNSWGWENLSFIIRIKKSNSILHISRVKNMVWTKNGPVYFEILPGHQMKVPVQLTGKSWEADKDISKIRNEPVSIKAVFTITKTPEGKELNVWVGKAESEWLPLRPPHHWLFPAK